METIKLWIYIAQMKRMVLAVYPTARQVADEIYEVIDTPEGFDGTQTYVGDMCGMLFSVVS